jgi:hypothetical protein
MYEAVSRLTGPILSGQTATGGQSISKFNECAAGILRRVWNFDAMMQMNLNFTPTRVAVLH